MKFSTIKPMFSALLKKVSGSVEKKVASDVKAGVLLVVNEEGFLVAEAGDNELQISCTGGQVDNFESGEVSIAFRKLNDIVRNLPSDAGLNFLASNNSILLSANNIKFSLVKSTKGSLPPIGTDFVVNFEVMAKSLLGLLSKTALAMADMDVRYFLNGMLWRLEKNKLTCVASDGHRLCVSELVISNDFVGDFLIPRRTVLELLRLLPDCQGPVNISLGNNSIVLSFDNTVLKSRLLEGRFPDYKQIIPDASSNILLVSKIRLKESCTRVAVLFNEKYKAVRFVLASNKLTLVASNQDSDKAEETLEVDYSGVELDIGFNIKYIIEFLSILPEESVEIMFSGPNSATLIRGCGNPDIKYVVMPMRV